ncbi:carbohydrate ABC transporter permease [Dactylosporangium fulvum]|uniref:Carbohydrate ABC transporter permease n=1 Tax=Dactylosporangium fulvum TaxID=53359 RepID=A0ABY5VS26_9ACTN|nr:carbohydrate ABC transporter permease [Dactylosporangium fulvum]UWP80007.1 carbohydrate ABC transporter permease [Dactylosporangium fulvum]
MSTETVRPNAVAPATGRAAAPARTGWSLPGVLARITVGVLLLLYAAISLYPFLWMVSAAFKDQFEVVRGGNIIPRHPTLHTLTETWNELHFFDYFLNSLKVTGLTVLLVLVIYAAAGYAFSVLRFPGRKALYRLFMVLLFVPGVTVLLPVVLLENKLGLLGNHWGLILPFVNGSAPLSILMMTNAFDAIPSELREAARVDGAGELRIFTTIYLPLSRPVLITIAVLTAIPTWNEYLLTRVSLNDPGAFTLPIALQNLQSGAVQHYNVLMAGALIVVIPVIILFVAAQRYFVNGLMGAVKA